MGQEQRYRQERQEADRASRIHPKATAASDRNSEREGYGTSQGKQKQRGQLQRSQRQLQI